ncbi:MAG: T9SS type A sorting domain-containing protein [Ignavibacterium sp.]|jgi:probable HAF family extracellular repeat protein|uniref:T9SS type A sorting domain-containing protein n=1 Tax=Ignavibacterium sp. TaxID=2651167 RepID=UPI003296E080
MKLNFFIMTLIFILLTHTDLINSQSLTWLGTLGGETSIAYDVSDDGTIVVGWSENSQGDTRAFIWTPANGMQIPAGLESKTSWIRKVTSDASILIGTSGTANGINYQAIKWSSSNITFLGSLGGSGSFNNSEGYSCNADASIIIGTATTSNNIPHAFKWTASGGIEDLGTFGNVANRFSAATGISDDASLIAGHSEYSGNYTRPCFWLNGGIHELFTKHGTSIERGEVTSVSPNGNYICGYIDDSTTYYREHAYLWSGNPSFTGVDVGLLSQVLLGTSIAFDVNDNGQVVGTATDTLYEDNAFYWYLGSMLNLNLFYSGILPSGSKLISANAISSNGRYIVGKGFNSTTNRTEAFLLDRGPATDVNSEIYSLNVYSLEQNYPNPFNPSTKISWQSPVGGHQTLKVYDVLGNEVATLIDEEKSAGFYEIEFNASQLASGIYFYRLKAGSFVETKKMVLLK